MVFVGLYQRTSSSYDVALQQYLNRVALGVQPSTRIIDLFNVETEEALLLLTNFLYLGMVILLYLKMLKRSKPVRLRALMLGYNTLNVCLSLYVACSLLFFKIRSRGGEYGGGFVCNPLRTDAEGQRVAQVFAVFYLQKYLELVDTVLFLLRRSFRQVTFFHLFHHCSITVIVGSVLPFDFNGDMYLPIMLNSIVHVLVYLHYVLAAFGRHSWWSRYLTSLQLTQFLVIFLQSATAFYVGPTCGSPDFVKVVLLLYMGSLLGLFTLFLAKRSLVGPTEDPVMCGVIKSLENDDASRRRSPPSWHGNAALDETGCVHVKLPTGFSHEPSARVMYCYQLTPIGAPMPGLFVSSEISSAGKGEGYSFSVKGGKPRLTISWMVTRVQLQSDLESHEDDEILLRTEAETLLGKGIRSRIPRSSISGGEGWGMNDVREVVR